MPNIDRAGNGDVCSDAPFFRGIIQTCPCCASHLRSVSWMYCITRNRCGQEGVSDGDELIPGKAKLWFISGPGWTGVADSQQH